MKFIDVITNIALVLLLVIMSALAVLVWTIVWKLIHGQTL